MKHLKTKRIISTLAIFTLGCSLLSGCGDTADKGKTSKSPQSLSEKTVSKAASSGSTEDKWEEARTTPYTPYPETVTYTVGLQVNPKVAYPEGSTDNA